MSRHAFDKIKAGLADAIAIARGEADPSTYRVHVPAEVDVKAIRRKLGMTQAEFARSFGFALDAVQNWEQGRRRPHFPQGHRPGARRRPPRPCGVRACVPGAAKQTIGS
jgi:putative transcriptional regulator